MRKGFTGLCARGLPVLGLGVGIAVLLFSLTQWWNVKDTLNDQVRFEEILKLGKADAFLNAKLDLYNKRADDTRSLLV